MPFQMWRDTPTLLSFALVYKKIERLKNNMSDNESESKYLIASAGSWAKQARNRSYCPVLVCSLKFSGACSRVFSKGIL